MTRPRVTVARVQAELAKLGAPFELVVAVPDWLARLPADVLREDPAAIQREIIDGAARPLYVDTWMSEGEEHGIWMPSGQEMSIEDYAPKTPRRVLTETRKWAADVARENGLPLWVYYLAAAAAPGKHARPPTPYLFGWYTMWSAKGAGVSWTDDHPEPLFTFTRDPPEVWIQTTARDFRGYRRIERR